MSSTRGRFEYLEGRRISKIIFLILPFIIAILSFTPLHAEDKTKTVIGAVEEVVLFPWGVKLPARIDTGAGMTSLDVRDLTVKNKVAQFRLPEKYGNTLISLPVIRRVIFALRIPGNVGPSWKSNCVWGQSVCACKPTSTTVPSSSTR